MPKKAEISVTHANLYSKLISGYYGGAVDYYKKYGKNLKYYDVNSLYPYAMTFPIPYEIINHYKNMDNIKLKDFFGFIKVEVYCPKTVTRPLLPYRLNGRTIYPTGKWIGYYFSPGREKN